jgi:hypothetical protein
MFSLFWLFRGVQVLRRRKLGDVQAVMSSFAHLPRASNQASAAFSSRQPPLEKFNTKSFSLGYENNRNSFSILLREYLR